MFQLGDYSPSLTDNKEGRNLKQEPWQKSCLTDLPFLAFSTSLLTQPRDGATHGGLASTTSISSQENGQSNGGNSHLRFPLPQYS